MDKKLTLKLNVGYGLVQGFYWMIYCCVVSYASAYLTGRGFSTTALGLILAMGYLIATISQQAISSATDRAKKISVLEVMDIVLVLLIVSLLILLTTKGTTFITVVIFVAACTLINVLQPLANALNFYMERTECTMNYGACRSMGSLFFSVISIIVGRYMSEVSINAAPVAAIIVCLLMLLDQFYIGICIKGKVRPKAENIENLREEKVSALAELLQFVRDYRMFFVFLLGTIGVFFGHVVINNFFYQIVENVGGNTADLGKVNSLQAIVELPTMMFSAQIVKKIKIKHVMTASCIFFIVKSFLTMSATSIGMIYFSVLFQSVAFAAFIPASVIFVNELMEEKDAVKGQAYLYSAMAIANFLSCVISGKLFEIMGVYGTLLVATIVTALGAVIAIFGLFRIKSKY
ncbi:MAG: MFS transporter [Pseudobutyrivibrio sp.]|nr:MFS transporter [Pseudobutyrivibrio sp.]